MANSVFDDPCVWQVYIRFDGDAQGEIKLVRRRSKEDAMKMIERYGNLMSCDWWIVNTETGAQESGRVEPEPNKIQMWIYPNERELNLGWYRSKEDAIKSAKHILQGTPCRWKIRNIDTGEEETGRFEKGETRYDG